MTLVPRSKSLALVSMICLYVLFGLIFFGLVKIGIVPQLEPTPIQPIGIDSAEYVQIQSIPEQLRSAQAFVDEKLVRTNGHVDLYHLTPDTTFDGHDDTNSEAMSYYLLWNAREGNKESFDNALSFIEWRMLHPELDYMMWRLNPQDVALGDGENIASDADLRAIRALLIAEATWGDPKYTKRIDALAFALEEVAITDKGLLAPYAGGEKGNIWRAQEIWFSYQDFIVFRELAARRGEPWTMMYDKMRGVTLAAQIEKGLYNSQLTAKGKYGNGIDGGGYGINSMWIMVRSAESGDTALMDSAGKSLEFYKQKYQIDAQLYSLYSSTGDALSGYDSPWVYALVGRAAVALNDEAFADAMIWELLQFQNQDPNMELYGAILETGVDDRVGQFVMQESILTMQEYMRMKEAIEARPQGS